MSKLIDTEKLARLAKALDDRAKAAVAAEQQRAEAAEQAIDAKADANAAAIEAINHAENGLLAQAKAFTNEEIEKVNEAMEAADQGLSDRLDELEGKVDGESGLEQMRQDIADNKAAIEKLNGGAEEEGSVAKAIKDAVDPVQGEVDALEGRMDAAEGRLDALEAEQDTQDAAIKAAQAAADKAQQEVDLVEERATALEGRMDAVEAEQDTQDAAIEAAQAAADKAQGEVDAVEGRMDAAEAAINKLNGGADEEGSVAKAVKDAVDPVQGEVDALEAVVGKAAEGEEAATGLYKYIDDQDAAKLQEAKDYADQQITALVDSAPDAMNTLNELAEAISAHQDVYVAYVEEMNGKLNEKVDKVEGSRLITEAEATAFAAKAEVADVEQCLEDAKDYADGEVAKVQGEVDAAEGRLDALEAEQDTQDAAIEAAQAAADKAQGEVDALEERMDAVEAEQLVQNQGIADNKAAIEKLNGGVDEEGSVAKSIADALEPYSTTEEMKVILGNVVNSLALTMENDKVVLKLGGVEGIAISEVSLDMATDDDIDAIVAGLDAE